MVAVYPRVWGANGCPRPRRYSVAIVPLQGIGIHRDRHSPAAGAGSARASAPSTALPVAGRVRGSKLWLADGLPPVRDADHGRSSLLFELRSAARASLLGGAPDATRALPSQRHARQARGRARRPVDARRAPHRNHAVLRRGGLDGLGRGARPGGMDRGHERGVREPHRPRLSLRGHAGPADGRCHLRVLRSSDRPRGRPAAGGGRRPGDRRGDPRIPRDDEGPSRSGPGCPGRDQHRPRRRGRSRLGPSTRVHGDGRRGQRRGPHGADGRARHRADHRPDAAPRRPLFRSRVAWRRRSEGQGRTGLGVPRRGQERRGEAEGPRAHGGARRTRQGGIPDRGGWSGQEPVDRRGPGTLGSASAPDPGRLAVPQSHVAALAVRLVRGRQTVRTVSTQRGEDRGRERHGRSGRRPDLARIIQDSADWLEPHMLVWRSLFGVGERGEEILEGQEFKRAITDLVVGSTRYFGSEPRLLVFEDRHWCDEADMGLLIETARLVDELPCLFLMSFRPDRRAPSWRLKQWLETEYPHRSADIVLSPLTDEETGALLAELLPEHHHSDVVRTQIIERTEGNPLFLEELAAAVTEQGPDSANPFCAPSRRSATISSSIYEPSSGPGSSPRRRGFPSASTPSTTA